MTPYRASGKRRSGCEERVVFGRVVVGVDGGQASFEACRRPPDVDPSAPIEVVSVVHVAEAARAGFGAAGLADELALESERALDEAVRIIGRAPKGDPSTDT